MKQLLDIQTELKAPKGQYNSFGKYKYRNAEDILEAVKPLLKKHKCTLVITDELVLIGDRYYIKATAKLRFLDSELVEFVAGYAREEENKKGMDSSQITGAASSYARKYALNGLFLIDDTKDSDATNLGENNVETAKPELTEKMPKSWGNAIRALSEGKEMNVILKRYNVSKENQVKLLAGAREFEGA